MDELPQGTDHLPHIGPPTGRRFPDVVLPDQHGHVVDLHAARAGRPAFVLMLRSAVW